MSRIEKIQSPWSRWHERLHKTLKKKTNLLPSGACLLLSISGGQDSMALLQLMVDLERLHKWKLHIWHGNHKWHKKSDQFAEELKKWCEEKNLCFYYDEANKTLKKTEQEARSWRYSSLIKTANFISSQNTHNPCNHVLTAHTSSDRAETILFNLARGSDLAGLTSLRQKRGLTNSIELIRPLLGFNRKETAEICNELGLPIWLDPSNQDLNLSRNKIRHSVLPVLEELHKGCTIRIAAMAERLSHYQEDQQALVKFAIKAISKNDFCLCRQNLMELPPTARKTLLAKWIENSKAPKLSSIQLEDISHKISKSMPPGSLEISKDWKIIWSREFVKISSPNNQ
tara:strand:+ start:40975 stop:42000 length:1026 start_codon:yes stop_codon:yes gene_type:complete